MNKKLRISLLLALDSVFAIIELVTGYAVHSLALVADSFHMFNDILSLVVALWAVTVANSASSPTFSYGLQRAEVLGALINAVFLLALCVTIILEAIQRFIDPPEISNPVLILVVGILGLFSNIAGLFLFHEHGHSHGGDSSSDSGHSHGHSHGDVEQNIHEGSLNHLLPEYIIAREENRLLNQNQSYGSTASTIKSHDHTNESHNHSHDVNNQTHTHVDAHTPLIEDQPLTIPHNSHHHSRPKPPSGPTKSMNMEGVFLHVLGDALGNIGVIITALFIWKTDYSWRFYCDPCVSLFITAIIFSTAIPLCVRASKVLLQATPSSINGKEVAEDILSLPGVEEIHDLHIWQLSEHQMVATLHVTVSSPASDFPRLARTIQECFAGYGIPTLTIQPEFSEPSSASTSGLRLCQSNGNLLSLTPK